MDARTERNRFPTGFPIEKGHRSNEHPLRPVVSSKISFPPAYGSAHVGRSIADFGQHPNILLQLSSLRILAYKYRGSTAAQEDSLSKIRRNILKTPEQTSRYFSNSQFIVQITS
ncbi:Hypothetical predicted protein [Prunus dulcis]|uniref:Uncharacterized protein n=1 Tax=Prunus dulcis TaxID=3755 RepID=A0A5E4FLE4_PRUDU|nr:hypothetical protein L3X38_036768 [Prunus dulcis]VVA28877.1 Hypothetical predicted protein [Prunus dulcis]